jgi:hypothetical protein
MLGSFTRQLEGFHIFTSQINLIDELSWGPFIRSTNHPDALTINNAIEIAYQHNAGTRDKQSETSNLPKVP